MIYYHFRFLVGHIAFRIVAPCLNCRPMSIWVADPRKRHFRVWNRVSIRNWSKVITTSGIWAVLSYFLWTRLVFDAVQCSIVYRNIKNMVLEVKIVFLSKIRIKLILLPVYGPRCTNSYRRCWLMMSAYVLLSRWSPTMCIIIIILNRI